MNQGLKNQVLLVPWIQYNCHYSVLYLYFDMKQLYSRGLHWLVIGSNAYIFLLIIGGHERDFSLMASIELLLREVHSRARLLCHGFHWIIIKGSTFTSETSLSRLSLNLVIESNTCIFLLIKRLGYSNLTFSSISTFHWAIFKALSSTSNAPSISCPSTFANQISRNFLSSLYFEWVQGAVAKQWSLPWPFFLWCLHFILFCYMELVNLFPCCFFTLFN